MSMISRVDRLLGYLDNLKIDLDGVEPLQASQPLQSNNINQSASSSSSYKPNAGSLPAQIMDALCEQKIDVQSQTHQPVTTSEQHAKVISLSGVLCKNLLVSEKRIKQKCQYLVIVPASKDKIQLKVLGKYLNVGGGLRTVSDPDLTFKMAPGSITPLAVLFDEANIVKVLIDTHLNGKTLLLHPGTNEATIAIKSDDLETYLNKYGKGVAEYVHFDDYIGDAAKQTALKLKQKNKTKQAKPRAAVQAARDDEIRGITYDKYTQFGDWYKEIVTKCDLIDYTDISGCYVLRPLSYFIWQEIQKFMDIEIAKLGVSNAYFPLFVSEDALKSESKHFADFNPEVAWVTHSGDTKLDKKIAVRPTSETIMYPMFAKWIRSFRDLPLKLNQWCNVVRWEFSNPTPFLRTREFLWQEGHTAHAKQADADNEVYAVLDMYARTYAEMCAVPTIKGIKTKNETFPGADYSTTVEGYIPGSGRGIQGATSHCLGKNFAKMFKINYLDENNETKLVIQNSWGFTTRSIGVMVMNHSDNTGLILPPKVAQIQCVIVPIYNHKKIKPEIIDAKCFEIEKELKVGGKVPIRTYFDNRAGKKPGYKFNEWELKGIPVRIEIGARDIEKNSVMVARRDEREEKSGKLVKMSVDFDDEFVGKIEQLLVDIHDNLYKRAVEARDANIVTIGKWDEFLKEIQNGKLVFAPHCNTDECEDLIQIETREYFASQPDKSGVGQSGKAKALCIPLEQQSDLANQDIQCFHYKTCQKKAKKWMLFGRSY